MPLLRVLISRMPRNRSTSVPRSIAPRTIAFDAWSAATMPPATRAAFAPGFTDG